MSALPDLSGRVRIDTTDLDRLDRKVTDTANNSETKMKRVGESFTRAGAAMTAFASVPIAAGIGFSIKAASDLAEAMNVTKITFGEGADEIDAFAKTAAQKLGQSERAAREATSSFGGLLQNMGFAQEETVKWSKDLTVLASDLGSAFNKEPEEAALALGSALRGETEAIRAYNVMLNQEVIAQEAVRLGLISSAKELDANSKAQATLSIIMQQTARYQGDFANTAEGLANKSRSARAQLEDTAASLGEQLLPAAAAAAGKINTLAVAFGTLTSTQQQALLGIGLFLVALGPMVASIGAAAKAVELFRLAMAKIGPGNFAALGGLGILLAGIGVMFVQRTAEAEAFIRAATQDMDTSNLQSLADAANEVNREFQASQASQKSLIGVFTLQYRETEKLMEGTQKLNDAYRTADQVLQQVTRQTGLSTAEAERLAKKNGIDLTYGVNTSTEALLRAVVQMRQSDLATDKLANANEELADNVKDAEERYDAFKKVLDLTFGSLLDADSATLALKERNLDLAKAYAEAGGKASLNTEKGRELLGALYDTIPAIEAEVSALTASGAISGETAAQKAALIERLRTLQKEYPALAPKIQPYIDKVNSIPETKNTNVTVNTAEAERKLLNLRAAFPDFIGPLPSGPVPGRADGGPISAGQFYQVGERGPELIYTQSAGTVLNAAQTRSLIDSGGGSGELGGVTVNFYGPVGDGNDVVSAMPEIVSALRAGVSK